VSYPGDRNEYRSEALYALRDVVPDPEHLDEAHVEDYDAAHAFGGETAPALRLGGEWIRLPLPAAAALDRYVRTLPEGFGMRLFATEDIVEHRPTERG
jgi:hypothetical protein